MAPRPSRGPSRPSQAGSNPSIDSRSFALGSAPSRAARKARTELTSDTIGCMVEFRGPGLPTLARAESYRWVSDLIPDRPSREMEIVQMVDGLPLTRPGNRTARWLVPATDGHRVRSAPILARQVDPEDWPLDLHREFCALEPAEATFADFAGRYGLLGFDVTLRSRAAYDLAHTQYDSEAFVEGTIEELRALPSREHVTTRGESWEAWAAFHRGLKQRVIVWDGVKRRDWKFLRSCVKYDIAGADFRPPDPYSVQPDQGIAPHWPGRTGLETIRSADALRLAEESLLGAVNTYISAFTVPYFVSLATREIGVVPMNLAGVLYGLFALEFRGKARRAVRCRLCREPFEPGTRSDQEYCSKAHKVQASRLRKKGVSV